MNDLNNKLKAMIAENENTRAEYLKLLNDLKDAQDKRINLVVGITEGIQTFFNHFLITF